MLFSKVFVKLFVHDGCPFVAMVLRQLESQLRQLRLRCEAEAADAAKVKEDLENAQAERMALQKKIGLLARKNEDAAAENGERRCFYAYLSASVSCCLCSGGWRSRALLCSFITSFCLSGH